MKTLTLCRLLCRPVLAWLLPGLLLGSLLARPATAQTPRWAWAQLLDAVPGSSHVKQMQSDAAGNVYVLGEYRNGIALGNRSLIGAGGVDVFVAKFSPTGQCLWAMSGGGTNNDYAGHLALDQLGNVYATATILTDFTTACGLLPNPAYPAQSTVLWKLTANGNCVWTRLVAQPINITVTGSGDTDAVSLTTDSYNRPVVIVHSVNDVRIGTQDYSVQGTASWITYWNSDGMVRWVKEFRQSNNVGVYLAAGSTSTGTYISGGGIDVQLGSIFLPGRGGFLALIDTAGVWQWAKAYNVHNTNNGQITQLSVKERKLVTSGFIGSTGSFSYEGQTILPSPPSATGYNDGFVIGLTDSGAFSFAYRMPTSGSQGRCIVTGQALEPGGALYLTGYFNDTVELLPNQPRVSLGVQDGFVVKLDSAGQPVWALTDGVPPPQFMAQTGIRPQGIAVAGPAGPVIGGILADTVSLGSLPLVSIPRQTYDLFLAGIAQVMGTAEPLLVAGGPTLWPNPAGRKVQLAWPPQAAPTTVQVLDVLGRLVQTLHVAPQQARAELTCAALPPGVYHVRLLAGTYRAATRLVVATE